MWGAILKEAVRRWRYLDARHYRTLNLPYRLRTNADFEEAVEEFTDSLNNYLQTHADPPSRSHHPLEYKFVPARGWTYEFSEGERDELTELVKGYNKKMDIPSRTALNALKQAHREIADLKAAIEHYKAMVAAHD